MMMMRSTTVASFFAATSAFVSVAAPVRRAPQELYGIFDGVKDAFSQDTTILEEERVTPFDRWLGLKVGVQGRSFAVPDDFVDSMDEANYVVARLPKPMGIVFEENDPSCGGVFVASLADDGAAVEDGSISPGDQLVSVGGILCKGMDFDSCLAHIQNSDAKRTKLVFFRGGPSSLYGNLGASDEWMNEFMAKQRADE